MVESWGFHKAITNFKTHLANVRIGLLFGTRTPVNAETLPLLDLTDVIRFFSTEKNKTFHPSKKQARPIRDRAQSTVFSEHFYTRDHESDSCSTQEESQNGVDESFASLFNKDQ